MAQLATDYNHCQAKHCQGVPVESSEEDTECPVCYEIYKPNEFLMFIPCNHAFCSSCSEMNSEQKTCHTCRQIVEKTLKASGTNIQINRDLVKKHELCDFDLPLREYVQSLNEEWLEFVRFIITNETEEKYKHVRGNGCIDFKKFNKQLKKSDRRMVIFKTQDGEEHIILNCHMPKLSIRLLISENDDKNYEANDKYADEVIKHLNTQIRSCCSVIPQLLGKQGKSHKQGFVDYIFIRKFDKYTCKLLITSYMTSGLLKGHEEPMKNKLGNVQYLNFDETHFNEVRKSFPPLMLANFLDFDYKEKFNCLCLEKQPPDDDL